MKAELDFHENILNQGWMDDKVFRAWVKEKQSIERKIKYRQNKLTDWILDEDFSFNYNLWVAESDGYYACLYLQKNRKRMTSKQIQLTKQFIRRMTAENGRY